MTVEVILTKGLPASGKSTWARGQLAWYPGRYKRVCKDDLRAMMDNGRYSRPNERFLIRVRDFVISAAVEGGQSVIVDDTNLAPKHEEALRELVGDRATVWVKVFTTPLQECIDRDQAREYPVGAEVIRRMSLYG